MARSDLLLNLVRAGGTGDKTLFTRSVAALIAEERAKQHHVFADKLAVLLKESGGSPTGSVGVDEKVQHLFYEVIPERTLDDLILSDFTHQCISELVEENLRRDLLRSYNLEPRHRILLTGPPGNGKTALAEVLAGMIAVPLFVVRYDALIGAYLGETASRLQLLFDFVKTRHCVLFFDEFDVIGKERGDAHETGEIKRVVSSLLLQIDALPSHVTVVTATNHAELLDKAIWRRFQLILELPAPTLIQVEEWCSRFAARSPVPLGYSIDDLAKSLAVSNFAQLEDFATDVLRRYVLSIPQANMKDIVRSRLELWKKSGASTPQKSSKRSKSSTST